MPKFTLSIEGIEGETLSEVFNKLTKIATEPLVARLASPALMRVNGVELRSNDLVEMDANAAIKKLEDIAK